MLSFAFLANAQYSLNSSFEYKQDDDSTKHAPLDWFNLDYEQDNVVGVSTERAYVELLKNKKSKPVIVAIIDSGVDVDHEDLKDKIWVNKKEIAGNGIDDDHNGYVDDIHGWNFIGGADGKMVIHDNMELTRIYALNKDKYEGKTESDFKGKELAAFKKFKSIESKYNQKLGEAEKMNGILSSFMKGYTKADSILKSVLNKEEYTQEDINNLKSEDENIKAAKSTFAFMKMMGVSPDDIKEGAKHYKNQLEYGLNLDLNSRELVGDNYQNKKERKYGNNKAHGVNPVHGTHVAGIVGANRNNDIGMKGVADNVQLMVIRTVPDGDERDKDVANSIYYAVKNGAKIINMSFGKSYSPYKKYVDKAVRYAERKGVLLVHAAGNDGANIEEEDNFPNAQYQKNGKWASNWIEVGASKWNKDGELAADFSNYGQTRVDLFAPGVEIYSTVPGSKYKSLQGTSMASPVVAGVAALVLSYYPDLKAKDLKKILVESAVPYKNLEVRVPGTKDDTKKFGTLSRTGAVVNAYQALKMAENYKK